eukprot:3476346-Rhodomonas_salina.1
MIGGAKKGFLGSLGFGGGKAEGMRMDCMAASDDLNLVVRGIGRAVEVWDIRMQKRMSVDRSHTGDVHSPPTEATVTRCGCSRCLFRIAVHDSYPGCCHSVIFDS